MNIEHQTHPDLLASIAEMQAARDVLYFWKNIAQANCRHEHVVEYALCRRRQRICLRCRMWREGWHHELEDRDGRTVEVIEAGFHQLKID